MKFPRPALAIFFLYSITYTEAFFGTLFDDGSQGAGCDKWDIGWSPCWATGQKSTFMRFPANCQIYNPYMANFVQNGGLYTMNLAYKYLNKVNKSPGPCGMCSFQVNCARICNIYTGPEQQALVERGVFPMQPASSSYGVKSRPCARIEQSSACIADINQAYDPVRGICQMWPPLHDQAMPDTVGPTKQIIQYNVPPTPCIFLNGQCYCCCYPYIPDKNTLKCVRVA